MKNKIKFIVLSAVFFLAMIVAYKAIWYSNMDLDDKLFISFCVFVTISCLSFVDVEFKI